MYTQFNLRNSAINPFNVIQLLNSEKTQQNEKHFNIHYRDHHVYVQAQTNIVMMFKKEIFSAFSLFVLSIHPTTKNLPFPTFTSIHKQNAQGQIICCRRQSVCMVFVVSFFFRIFPHCGTRINRRRFKIIQALDVMSSSFEYFGERHIAEI